MSTHSHILQIPKHPLIFVDIEAGPDQAYIWLISVLVENRPDSLRLFYAKTPYSEKNILTDFLSYCNSFANHTICQYGGFDERLTLRQMDNYKLNGNSLGRWFDIKASIDQCGIPSLDSTPSLKHIAEHFGYKFNHSGMDGADAFRMYEQNVSKQDASITKKLQEYGADDVRSLQCIMSGVRNNNNIRITKSWTPQKNYLPSSFEKQCVIVKSRISKGESIPSIAKRFHTSQNYISTRYQAEPKKWRGKKISFKTKKAIKTGILSKTTKSQYNFLGYTKNHIMYGQIIEQLSQNTFKVHSNGGVFQIHRYYFKIR